MMQQQYKQPSKNRAPRMWGFIFGRRPVGDLNGTASGSPRSLARRMPVAYIKSCRAKTKFVLATGQVPLDPPNLVPLVRGALNLETAVT